MRLGRSLATLGTALLTLVACSEPADEPHVGSASGALPSDASADPDPSPTSPRTADAGELVLTVRATDVAAHAHLAAMAAQSAKLPAIVTAVNDQLALPGDIPVTLQECPTPAARYSRTQHSITICYGYLATTEAALAKLAGVRAGSPPMVDRIENATAFVLAHMIGHALVGELGLPTTGGEESAADDIVAVTLLRGEQSALLADAVSAYRAYGGVSDELANDAHALGKQRFADIACLAWAYDRKRPDLAPRDGTKRCFEELGRKSRAWKAVRAEHRRVRHLQPATFADLGDARAISLGDAPIDARELPVALDIADTALRITCLRAGASRGEKRGGS